jgi:hypothetical protein
MKAEGGVVCRVLHVGKNVLDIMNDSKFFSETQHCMLSKHL